MFFTFHQNNAGGFFKGQRYVIVEANSSKEANDIAQKSGGVYFDGVAKGIDCDCCGDRWTRQYWDDSGKDMPEIYGQAVTPEDDALVILKN